MWIACLAAKPAVSRLEKEIKDACDLIWIEIRSDDGREIWKQYKLEAVPTFILLNKKGDLLLQKSGSPPSKATVLDLIYPLKSTLKNEAKDNFWFFFSRINTSKHYCIKYIQ